MIIDPSIVSVFNFWHGLVGKKKPSTPLKREPKRSKIAKFESYLLENNEDMAPPRGNILQTFFMVLGANWPFTLQSQQNFNSDFG